MSDTANEQVSTYENRRINKYHLEVIELKYQGFNYPQIVEEMKKRIGRDVIKIHNVERWFAKGGVLHGPYQEYRDAKFKEQEEIAKKIFKNEVENAAKVMQVAMAKLLEAKDYEGAAKIAGEILDRAGLVKVNKSEVKTKEIPSDEVLDEEIYTESERVQGSDPRTGLPARSAAFITN